MEIKHGAIVWLKSGGPKMTVNGISAPQKWACSWFLNNKLEHGVFHESALTTTDPNTPNVTVARG